MDAYEELQSQGRFGPVSLTLLFDLTRQEAQRFPVLRPTSGWNGDAIEDLIHTFFADKGEAITSALLATVTDIDSMRRYIRASVRNFLVDQARKRPLGRIRRKIEDLLASNGHLYSRVPDGNPGAGQWHLNSIVRAPYAGDFRTLVTAAKSVKGIKPVRWDGSRQGPLATDAELNSILSAVFLKADGSLDIPTLTLVLVERFPYAVEMEDTVLDDRQWELYSTPAEQQPGYALGISESAFEVYCQLSPSQRSLLPHLGKPVEERMEILELGRSQTIVISNTLKAMMKSMVPDDDDRAAVAMEIVRLCIVNP